MQELSKSLNRGGRRRGRSSTVIAGIVAAVAFTHGAAAEMITTVFERNNGGSRGGAVYFDITVGANPIEVTGFDTNARDAQFAPSFGWSVYTTPGTSVGVHTDAAAWTLVSAGSGLFMGQDNPSPVTLDNSFVLAANTTYGMALVIGLEAEHEYSGSGTDPAPGMLQYSNADVTLDLGWASNVPFEGSVFFPRIWNGTIHYNVIPAPGGAAALAGLGFLAAHRRRRDRRRTETSPR